MPEKFRWPCDIRRAHGPHQRKPVGTVRLLAQFPMYVGPGGKLTANPDCPGVKAHPATMIGGKQDA